jgi:hypothetical protein
MSRLRSIKRESNKIASGAVLTHAANEVPRDGLEFPIR